MSQTLYAWGHRWENMNTPRQLRTITYMSMAFVTHAHPSRVELEQMIDASIRKARDLRMEIASMQGPYPQMLVEICLPEQEEPVWWPATMALPDGATRVEPFQATSGWVKHIAFGN